ncbi:hypothetical protein KC865_00560 [Candidatus Kaiserbacteria bacterium]|nr:hypothetical protein [Candidatus Kaiserbacteria bacterium]USN91965.1 MAG: hypothetical protein H6782_03765 [Candidatus Nomurabacteria bacterium]
MYQGNWKCSNCGGAITELPFEPRSESGLTCRSCWSKKKDRDNQHDSGVVSATEIPDDAPEHAEVATEPAPGDDEGEVVTPGEKTRFTGNWQCADCGAEITSLPFTPRSTNNLKCLDCYKKSKS